MTIGHRETARRRTARITHAGCDGYCRPIEPGDVYLELVEFPGGELGYADSAGRPVRMAVCAPCAVRAGDGRRVAVRSPAVDFVSAVALIVMLLVIALFGCGAVNAGRRHHPGAAAVLGAVSVLLLALVVTIATA